MISPEEASLIISKWRDERTPLLFWAKLPRLSLKLERCRVEFDGALVRAIVDDDRCIAAFWLRDAEFEYGEVREPEVTASRSGLLISLSRNERLFFIANDLRT